MSSESDDLDAFVTEFDNDQQIESTDEQRIKLIAEAPTRQESLPTSLTSGGSWTRPL